MKYIKLFQNNAAYQAYADSAEYVEPHVSLAEQENELHYNKPPKTPKWIATYQDGHTESAECGSSSEIISDEITLENLVSVEIGDCVTSIGYNAFASCSGLTSVDIPNSVTTIGEGAFYSCSGLTSVVIPDSVTSIGGLAFGNCSGLTSVTIPSGVTSIGMHCFFVCANLQSVTVNATTPPTLGEIVFFGSPIQTIFVPAESVDAYKAAEGWSQYASRIQPIV